MNQRQATIVRGLVDHDSRNMIQFEPGQANVLPGVSGSAQEVDSDLEELTGQDWLEGERETVGDTIVWTHVRVSVGALQRLNDWPPAGKEHELGPWTPMTWGQHDLPLLRNSHPGNLIIKPVSMQPTADWNGYLRLWEAGLISAVEKDEGLDRVQITDAGRNALKAPDA